MVDYAQLLTILYVEDEEDIRTGYYKALKKYTKKVYLAKNGNEGIELYKKYLPDIVISDINMPVKNGIDMAKEIKEINKEQAIIFTTAHTESKYTLEALTMQVDGYIIKPVDKNKLKEKIEKIAKNIITEIENKKHQKILQRILDNQTSITILTDFHNIEFASKSFFSLLGIKTKEEFFNIYSSLLDIFVNHIDYIHGTDLKEFLDMYHNSTQEMRVVSIPAIIGDVKAFFIEIDRIDELFILTLTDITQIQKEKLSAKQKATHDKLTSIYNRAKFEEVLTEELKKNIKNRENLSIAILDIDHFKNVNDTYGHIIGDQILKLLSKTCSNNIEKTDTFARWGGEEFILLMKNTNIQDAYKKCEKLRKEIANVSYKNLPKITISIGVTDTKPNDTIKSIFQRADTALYKAKKEGRNRVICYE